MASYAPPMKPPGPKYIFLWQAFDHGTLDQSYSMEYLPILPTENYTEATFSSSGKEVHYVALSVSLSVKRNQRQQLEQFWTTLEAVCWRPHPSEVSGDKYDQKKSNKHRCDLSLIAKA